MMASNFSFVLLKPFQIGRRIGIPIFDRRPPGMPARSKYVRLCKEMSCYASVFSRNP